jgi:hypothetical protein
MHVRKFLGPLSLSKGKIMDLIKEHVDPLIQRYVNSDKKLKDTRNIILEKLEQHHYLNSMQIVHLLRVRKYIKV